MKLLNNFNRRGIIKMNKEEMKRRLEENVEPKYNKQRNLEEIKSNLIFTNEKEIMESMVQEKQQQTKRFRWITTLSIIFACVLLIGTNCITYFTTYDIIMEKFNNKKNIIFSYLEKNFDSYNVYPIYSLFIEDKYEFSIYQGEKENQIGYVYFVENLNEENNNPLSIKIVDNKNQSINIIKKSSEEYVLGELNLEDLTQGSQLTIDIYENDNFLEQRIITL